LASPQITKKQAKKSPQKMRAKQQVKRNTVIGNINKNKTITAVKIYVAYFSENLVSDKRDKLELIIRKSNVMGVVE
jgi:hypothetical protein